MPKAGEQHYLAQLTDANVRLIRALRERHGWPYSRIAEVHHLSKRTVANFCLYTNRATAGRPDVPDFAAADRVADAYAQALTEAHHTLKVRILAIAG